jgi:hypothetical protein
MAVIYFGVLFLLRRVVHTTEPMTARMTIAAIGTSCEAVSMPNDRG